MQVNGFYCVRSVNEYFYVPFLLVYKIFLGSLINRLYVSDKDVQFVVIATSIISIASKLLSLLEEYASRHDFNNGKDSLLSDVT